LLTAQPTSILSSDRGMPSSSLLACFLGIALLSAQTREPVPPQILPAPQKDPIAMSPPPPVPPEEAPKPVTPARIRVGGQPQQAYFGPVALWFHCCGNMLSDEELAKLERVLSANPGDICARGQLIANLYPAELGQPRVARTGDLIWMIQHYPEWDGFLLDPSDSRVWPRSKEDYSGIKDAWLGQVRPDQRNGSVLHNAAMFFAIRELEVAASLLQRAIELQPDVPVHVERLGMVYARVHLQELHSKQLGITDEAAWHAFTQQAESTLLASNDWVLVAGALAAIGRGHKSLLEKGLDHDLAFLLAARLKNLTNGEETYSSLLKLPSRSNQYRRSECDEFFRRR
jgi:hypothetical protein